MPRLDRGDEETTGQPARAHFARTARRARRGRSRLGARRNLSLHPARPTKPRPIKPVVEAMRWSSLRACIGGEPVRLAGELRELHLFDAAQVGVPHDRTLLDGIEGSIPNIGHAEAMARRIDEVTRWRTNRFDLPRAWGASPSRLGGRAPQARRGDSVALDARSRVRSEDLRLPRIASGQRLLGSGMAGVQRTSMKGTRSCAASTSVATTFDPAAF